MRYILLKSQLNKLEEKLNKFNKKFQKYGEGGITYKVVETYIVDNPMSRYFRKELVNIEIEGKYQIKDYEFVAKLEYNDEANKNIIKGMVDTIPVKYLTRCECDHCKSDRVRKHTILLKKENDYIQVGSKCVNDYLGVDITHYASYLSFVKDIPQMIEEYNDEGLVDPYTPEYFSTREVLEQGYVYVKEHGYTSRKMVDTMGGNTTAEIIKDMLMEVKYKGEIVYPKAQITDNTRNEVDNVIEFVKTLNDTNIYNYNLKTLVVETKFVQIKDFGIVVSAIASYLKEKENRKENVSEYVGQIGDKVEITSNVKVLTTYKTEYGYNNYTTSYIYKFEENGNVFIWKTSTYLNPDKIYKISGKIKEHSEYKGLKQTVLTRCKCEEIKEQETIKVGTNESDKAFDNYFKIMEEM